MQPSWPQIYSAIQVERVEGNKMAIQSDNGDVWMRFYLDGFGALFFSLRHTHTNTHPFTQASFIDCELLFTQEENMPPLLLCFSALKSHRDVPEWDKNRTSSSRRPFHQIITSRKCNCTTVPPCGPKSSCTLKFKVNETTLSKWMKIKHGSGHPSKVVLKNVRTHTFKGVEGISYESPV